MTQRAYRAAPGRIAFAALFWLGGVRLALWVLPFAKVRALVAWASRTHPTTRHKPVDPRAVGHAIRSASRAVPRASCLVQALAAQGLLARLQQPATLHLGATRSGSSLTAHAWVESGGHIVVGDGPGQHTPLTSIDL